jgi:hypothetical protein
MINSSQPTVMFHIKTSSHHALRDFTRTTVIPE